MRAHHTSGTPEIALEFMSAAYAYAMVLAQRRHQGPRVRDDVRVVSAVDLSGARALGLCKFQAATGYGGLSGLCEAKAGRRRVLVMGAARVAAFRALVLGILRLAHATDGRPTYKRQKAPGPSIAACGWRGLGRLDAALSESALE
jgi:hypothetical protein